MGEMGQALEAPLPKRIITDELEEWHEESYEELLNEEAPEVIALHPSPSQEEDMVRYNFFEDHVSYLDDFYDEWDPTLIMGEDTFEMAEEEKGYSLEDLGLK